MSSIMDKTTASRTILADLLVKHLTKALVRHLDNRILEGAEDEEFHQSTFKYGKRG
jgi:hypothetical protein